MNADSQVMLHSAADGGLALTPDGVAGGSSIALTFDPAGLPAATRRSSLISRTNAFTIPDETESRRCSADRSPCRRRRRTAVDGRDIASDPGRARRSVRVRRPARRDVGRAIPTLRVWAPTARAVDLHLFVDSDPATAAMVLAMTRDTTGVWSITGDGTWKNRFYLFGVEVFVRTTGQVEHNLVTDPYSLSLARNSRSQIVDLDDAPRGRRMGCAEQADARCSGRHRALRAARARLQRNDVSVPEAMQGTFKAFTDRLARDAAFAVSPRRASRTFISFRRSTSPRSTRTGPVAGHPTASAWATRPTRSSSRQPSVRSAVRTRSTGDTTRGTTRCPEGSYATIPTGRRDRRVPRDGAVARPIGLRIVMDVVYNHTNAAGQNGKSVLDRIVPGYYHRSTPTETSRPPVLREHRDRTRHDGKAHDRLGC